MDWLLTVPLLLIEILLVMKLSDQEYNSKAKTLGIGSALMTASGYYGELTVTGDLTDRWVCWFLSMSFFLYIVQELLVGLSDATNKEEDPAIKAKSDVGFQAVYNMTSFGLATMMATTMYLWFRMSAVADRFKSAVCISGL